MLPHLLLLSLLSGPTPMAPTPVEGRWDMVLQTPEGARPAWLEVRHSGVSTLVGQYVGSSGSARPIAKILWENGIMRFSIPPQWEREPNDLTFEGRMSGDSLVGSMTRADGGKQSWSAHRAPTLRRTAAPVWGTPITLFNGRDLSGWKAIQGENQWRVENGTLRNTRGGANLATERTFTDFKLHVEFRYPKDGNSGVYLRGRYEVQVADTPGSEPGIDMLGAIYGHLLPNANAARAPGAWQVYDITLVGRTVTVVANGKTIICEAEIPGITGGALDSNEGAPGPIFLQGDHGPVEYRTIRITPAR
ncbi:MAG: DUF1080 domain-containing protein [Cytophagaceae bacterium]|nr:DUF1080 domain-containing protein [Gemmatimonadaceae bacterium]